MKRVFLFLVVLFFYTSSVFSQFKISGRITSESDEPLTGANVTIVNSYTGAICNLNGSYELSNLKKGTLTIKASFIGYESDTKEVIVDKDLSIDFVLKHSDFLTDEVIVAATRANDNSPISFTNIEKKDLEKQNSGQDVPYLLSMTPSLVTSSDAGTGIGYTSMRIRGIDANRINVTVNGIPFNDSESHSVYWVDMPDITGSVDNIQIQRGVGTSTNGAAAFGATINLQSTSFNKTPYAELAANYGSFNSIKQSISVGSGLIGKYFTLDARLSQVKSDGYIDRGWSDLNSYFVSGAFYYKKNLLRFNMFSGLEETYQAWMGMPKASLDTNRHYNPYTYENQIDHYQQTHYQLLYSKEISSSLTLNTALHYTKGKGYYEEYKEAELLSKYSLNPVQTTDGLIESTDLVRRKWLDNDFYGITYSLNYKYQFIDATVGGGWNQYLGNHYGKVIWAKGVSNELLSKKYYENDGNKSDFNIFAKIYFQPVKKFTAYIDAQYRKINYDIIGFEENKQSDGTRKNMSQTLLYNFVNPKLGFTFDLQQNTKIYASFGVARREPTRADLVAYVNTNRKVTYETLYDLETGYKFQAENVHFNLNFYFMNYDNQLALTGQINDVGDALMVNVPKSYRQGIELIGGIRFFEKFRWDASMTFSKNKIKNFTEYVDDWTTWEQRTNNLGETDLSFSPNIIGGSQIAFEPFRGLIFSLVTKYVGKQYIDNTSNNERALDSYFVNDFKINYNFKFKWIREINLQLSVNNIFSEKYVTNAWIYRYYEENTEKVMDGYFPQAERNFMAGVIVKF